MKGVREIAGRPGLPALDQAGAEAEPVRSIDVQPRLRRPTLGPLPLARWGGYRLPGDPATDFVIRPLPQRPVGPKTPVPASDRRSA